MIIAQIYKFLKLLNKTNIGYELKIFLGVIFYITKALKNNQKFSFKIDKKVQVLNKENIFKFKNDKNGFNVFYSNDELNKITISRKILNRDPNNSFLIINDRIVCQFDDPRWLLINNICFISTSIKMQNYLLKYDIKNNNLKKLKIVLNSLPQGKNWTPIEVNGIYPWFIYQFDPLVIVKPKEVFENAIEYEIYCRSISQEYPLQSYDKFSIIRGGTNGINHNNVIYGICHLNYLKFNNKYLVKHIPLLWILKDFKIKFYYLNYCFNKNMRVIDPVALIKTEDKNTFNLFTSEYRRDHVLGYGPREINRYELKITDDIQ